MQGVGDHLQTLQRPRAPATPERAGNPYKQLSECDLGDAQRYFGRDRAITDLLASLGCGRLLILHADSGAGKTSPLQAGLMPRLLMAGHLAVYV